MMLAEKPRRRLSGTAAQVHDEAVGLQTPDELPNPVQPHKVLVRPFPVPLADGVIARTHHPECIGHQHRVGMLLMTSGTYSLDWNGQDDLMQRVVILGRGGAGKSTLARALGSRTGLPALELDKHFWQPGLLPLSRKAWRETQTGLACQQAWVMDGDLGPHDVLEARLTAADTVIVLDYPLLVCLWRAAPRSREARDFWLWHYRRRHLGTVLDAVQEQAPSATAYQLRSPRATRQFLRRLPSTR